MVTDVGGVDDKSFNQSTWEGLSKFGKDTGVHFAYKQSKTDADYAKNLEALTKDRYGLIFGVGYLLHEPISSIAIKNKKGKYAIVDSYVNQPNVASVVFKEHEASFLAGVVAGLKTETNNVGFIGGIQSSMIKAYEAGFVAGVKAVNPSAEVAIQYAGSFGAPDKGQAIASAMYSAGSDIIYHASGGTGNGVFAAAKQLKMKDPSQNIWVIGVDRDQHYEGMVKVDGKEYNVTLTSALKKVDVAVYDIASRTKKGQFPGGKAISYGIAENGVDVATANLDYNTIKKVEEYKKKVKSGEIKVPHN
ncbi:BMP family ABC transporter substrate-binding protein [Peribacillus glennii]|uniref:BMP family ABC transporter substrate-binding protein n=2 Tax=Peribacillus glennii TaxID=2303991 RepID=A0A372L7E9_9BACI|nr:BMP family ABC transporter substrate-binding protein [Peribacillus glennii]